MEVTSYDFEWFTLAPAGLFGEGKCNARYNKSISCDGEYIKSEGMCLRHACLFDIWIDQGGHRVYQFKKNLKTSAMGAWRRRQFYKWLDRLTVAEVEFMLGKTKNANT